jgi:hypothetical protein
MPFIPDSPTIGKFKPDAPIEGNLYTQGDVQYSPEGIPLSTSSYGTPTQGATKSIAQGLTSAVSLPLNVATGIAKAPAGVAQALSKMMGSNVGDIPINAINQIEQGTQAQMGGLGKVASQAGNIAGQVAPFMGGGGALPSLLARVGQGAKSGLISGLASPEETGLSPEEFMKAKGQNFAIQGGMGAAFPIVSASASKLADMVRGTKLSPQMQNAVTNAREVGYTVPPTQAGGGMVNRLLEGMAGKASTLQEASVRNQKITNELANKALGLDESTILSPEVLGSIRKEAGKVYDEIAKLPKKPAIVEDLNMNRLGVAEIDPKKMVYDLRVARNDADSYYKAYERSADPEALLKAKSAKAKASEIENQLEQYASDLGKTDLLPKLRDARQLIAKSYTVENALNQTTGTVNARDLASKLQKGKPLSGELKQIGEFAQAFPKAAQKPEIIGGTTGISPLDYTLAGLTGGASYYGGNSGTESGLQGLAALLARPAARKLVLSAPMQNQLAKKESKGLTNSEEAKQLAKILLMQQTANANK